MWSEDEKPQTQQQLEGYVAGEGHRNDHTLSLNDNITSKNTRKEAYERLLAKRKLEFESGGIQFTKNEGSPMQPITISAESEGEDKIADAANSVSKEGKSPIKRKVKRRLSSVLSSKLAWGVALRKQPRELKSARNNPLPNYNMGSKKKFSKRSKAQASIKRDDKDLQSESQGIFTNSEELKKCRHGQELPDDFKLKLSKEIEKQIFEGLDEISKVALPHIQVVEIEGLYPSTRNNRNEENVSSMQYEAKVKLMAVLHVPVTVQLLTDTNEPVTKEEGNDNENLLEVPDPMYYDFDKDRCEENFAAGQVWAVYDEVNAMPTRYVQINKLISTSPFKAEIQWLEPDCSSVEAWEWVKAGNLLTCGAYRKSKDLKCIGHVDTFSHIMKWEERHGVLDIYPLVGDIWAMFKDWEEVDGSKRIKSGYKIVRVVAVNEEETILTVVPLENYENHPTLFLEQRVQRPLKICKHETTRFSHRIPSYNVPGSKLHESFEGVLELDPASIPPNLCKD